MSAASDANEDALSMSVFRSAYDNAPRRVEVTWRQLVRRLCAPPQVLDKKENSMAYSPAVFDGTRANQNVQALSFLSFDLDDITAAELEEVEKRVSGIDCVFYTTYQHENATTEGRGRYRLVMRLSAPVPAAQWGVFWRNAKHRFAPMADDCSDEARIYFLPCVPPGAESVHLAFAYEGEPVDVDELLGAKEAPDAWDRAIAELPPRPAPDSSRWARAALEKEIDAVLRAGKGQRNNQLNASAFSLAQIVAGGGLSESEVIYALLGACSRNGLMADDGELSCRRTIRSGFQKGVESPRGPKEQPAGNASQADPAHAPSSLLGARWQTIAEIGGSWLDVEPEPRTWLLRRDDAGALARGTVGLLIAPGGRGKTWALVQLALSIATGRRWLDTYAPESTGRVVLALAEEDLPEVRRRLYYAVQALELDRAQRELAAKNIVALGLAGELLSLVEMTPTGAVIPSAVHAELVGCLGRDEHACVILDPLSRWAPDVEGNNAAATAAVQCLEQLTKGPGSPTVLVAHHTAKWSRREGNKGDAAGARGVTALTDGVRWVAALEGSTEKDLAFVVSKSNYGACGEPVDLVRAPGTGVLRPMTSLERDLRKVEEAADPRTAELRALVLGVIRGKPGIGVRDIRTAVRSKMPVRADAVDAMRLALETDGQIQNRGSGWKHAYCTPEAKWP